jgi:hypothetical protein
MLGFGASTQPTVIGDHIILQSLDKQRWRNLEVIAIFLFALRQA